MEALNHIDIETRSGYRSFELHQGDITDLPFNVDLMCISSFSGAYDPVPGTVIGALNNKGVNVGQLAEDCLFDYKDSFGAWVSKQLEGKSYKYILCLEMRGNRFELQEAIWNLFSVLSVLEFRRLKIQSIALPLIGAGRQRYEPEQVIDILIDSASDFLRHARYLDRIAFIMYNEKIADLLNQTMDDVLGRSKVRIPRGELVDGVKQEIAGHIIEITGIIGDQEVFKDLNRVISSESRSFELGTIARKLVEFMVQDLNPGKNKFELYKSIDSLHSIGVARWITGYMHVLRVFGNEAVHHKNKDMQNPKYVDEKDVQVCLFCIQRILNFYRDFKTKSENE